MPARELSHRFRIDTLQTLFAGLLVLWSSLAAAQSISNVTVSKKPGTQQQTTDFTLKISGKDFGADKSKVSVLVAPKAPILQPPVVTDVSQGGSTVLVTLTAPDDYDPSTVTVQVNGTSSDPYVLSTAAGLSDVQVSIRVYRSIIDPRNAADIFGRRIARRFLVFQLNITNRNRDYQFLIQDLSMDLSHVYPVPKEKGAGPSFTGRQELSSVELSLLRGVAEVGQSEDRRNSLLRTLRGVGNVAAGLIGIARFGKSYAPSVAVWNGPVLSAYSDIFPDYTVNQMNRLNDSAYSANTIVPKQQSKVVTVFLPQAILLTADQQKAFWKDSTSLWDEVDLRRIVFYVDGGFITNVSDLAPTLTSAVIDATDMKNFQNDKPEVKGSISGKYLSGADIKLLNTDLPGVSVRVDGTPTDQKLDFIVNSTLPVAPGKVLKLAVSKKGQDGVKETDVAITYSAAAPTLKADPISLTQGDQDKVATLTGTNFLPGSTQVVISSADGVTVGSVDVKSSTSLEAKVTVTATASTSNRQITVVTPGGSSAGVAVSIEKKK
jgi:hypothetical protein